MTGRLAVIASLALSGCCTTQPVVELPLPPRPVLLDWPAELYGTLPPEAQDRLTHNDLALKRYARELESVIESANEVAREGD